MAAWRLRLAVALVASMWVGSGCNGGGDAGVPEVGNDADLPDLSTDASGEIGSDAGAEADSTVPALDCFEGDVPAPCNGCPLGTVVPVGFVCVPAGVFAQVDAESLMAVREVTLTGDVFVQATEVTQGEWRALMGDNPSDFQGCGDTCPVEQVTWFDAVAYANARSVANGLAPCYASNGDLRGGGSPYACEGYRLPTEAEWAYASRAGSNTRYFWSNSAEGADEYAWHGGNASRRIHPVGQKRPNAWHLYDMAGNVLEWVHDGYAEYSEGAVSDPWLQGDEAADRVFRGGSWNFVAEALGQALRYGYQPERRFNYLGFRLARSRPL